MTTKYERVKHLINPFSRVWVSFGQAIGTVYFYTVEHYVFGFKRKVQSLRDARSEKFKAWKEAKDD